MCVLSQFIIIKEDEMSTIPLRLPQNSYANEWTDNKQRVLRHLTQTFDWSNSLYLDNAIASAR